MIKAILFDVDGVLVDSREAVEKFRKKFFVAAGYTDIDDKYITGSFHLPLKTVVNEALKAKGINNQREIDRVYNMVFDRKLREGQDFKFPKELEPVLEELHRHFKLGIITSRIRLGLDDIFDVRPIEKYFDLIVSLDDVKNHKPHPEPLYKALEKLNLKAEEAVYVGDSDTDILAAHAAGMPSIHLADIKHNLAHHHIKDFSEIKDAIKLIADRYENDNTD
ncbi:MAG TPA: HAD family hydrolase [Candidatus Saccharimonadales bacterium]|nr:HAD family hydrolase [Candidatus Saccharimonadales bacterium]